MAVFNTELLHRKWIHSHEEDNGEEMVYRPSFFKFPPSRGRLSFELKEQGTLLVGGPAPDDRQTNLHAHWQMDGNQLVFKQGAKVIRKLRILSLNNDRLVVSEG